MECQGSDRTRTAVYESALNARECPNRRREDPAECAGLVITLPVPCGAAVLFCLLQAGAEANFPPSVAVVVLVRRPYCLF